jgi:SAM-dependent methyltransferase
MLGPVTVPTLLGKLGKAGSPGIYTPRRASSAAEAKFVLRSLYKGLERQINAACPPPKDDSHWARYTATTHTDEYYALRSEFLQQVLDELKPRRVLDIGCNTGIYSALAARAGASVAAVDIDEGALDAVRRVSREERLDITACRANLCCPTPATGWMNRECASLVDRLRDRFDGVLMFAVLHHFLVTERVPLHEVAEFAASLTRDWLLIEFVAPHDELFQRLVRGRDALYENISVESFEDAFREFFRVERKTTTIEGRRWLYLLRRKAS